MTSYFPRPLKLRKWNHPSTVRRAGQQKAFVAFLKKTTQTKPCIEMMQLLLYQINWPTVLNLESVGTGPSSHPILLLFWGKFLCFSSGVFKILESDLFQDNFTMALYSFGGVNDQCSAMSWAVQDPTGMLALLSCLCCHGDSDCNKTQIINFHLYIIQLW